ncbi:MAG: gamma-glutamylcyclotransferase [Oscillospiraceae bacterium]|nr:gamma-glutamylcyclotransferase [Oscillospiraceae bacterium]
MEKRKFYLAYGSNLNIRQMFRRCHGARIIGTGAIPDYQLLFKGSKTGAYLTIEPNPGSSVPVAVWSVTENDEKRLDRYEGFPDFYYKAEMSVLVTGIRTGKSKKRDAFVYIMREDSPLGIPSEAYVKTCVEGYMAFGFDTEILRDAITISREEETK